MKSISISIILTLLSITLIQVSHAEPARSLGTPNDIRPGTYGTPYSQYCGLQVFKDGLELITVGTRNPIGNTQPCLDQGRIYRYRCLYTGYCSPLTPGARVRIELYTDGSFATINGRGDSLDDIVRFIYIEPTCPQ